MLDLCLDLHPLMVYKWSKGHCLALWVLAPQLIGVVSHGIPFQVTTTLNDVHFERRDLAHRQ